MNDSEPNKPSMKASELVDMSSEIEADIKCDAQIMAYMPNLGLIDGISVIFGLMVGSGIFSSSGLVFADVGSAGMSLMIWLMTGCLGLTGALWYWYLCFSIHNSLLVMLNSGQ